MAISRLCIVVFVHMNFWGERRVVGSSIRVGRMIFSIVEGLGFVGSRSRGFVWRPLALLVLYLLHMRKMLV